MPHIAAPMRRSNFHLEDAEVERLAIRTMDAVSAMDISTGAATPFAQLFALAEAYIDIDDTSRYAILESLLNRGIAPETIADEVVPALALYMGRLWEFDRISFAEVSIATARLQQTVRALTYDHKAERTPVDARILLVAPSVETHTLGIFVLSEQFRRIGCTVRVCVGETNREIVSIVRRTPYDMIGITAGSHRTLLTVRELVKDLRAGVPRNNKIVLGGAVSLLDLDLKKVTGVDYVCNSVEEALAKCHIEMQKTKASSF